MALIYQTESQKLMELALQLHQELGCGFREKVYQDAFEVLLRENGIPYEREKHISLVYHDVPLQHDFFYDFLCWEKNWSGAQSNAGNYWRVRITNYKLPPRE